MKKIIDSLENYILAGGLVIMTFITVINVISRKLLGMSMSFLEELTTSMFIFISLIGAAKAARSGSHLGLSIITDFLPKKYQKYAALITWAVAAFFSYFLIRYGMVMVQSEIRMNMRTPALGWPEWWFGMFIPIGGVFIIIRFTQWIIDIFKNSKEVE
ncbi:TRAP transporter small permease [Sedimentibacter sp.]|uniref:TRAP transporter small permease n=1 Tax=Sedimentibacter sp. TaxID=1960295 RepID=UPI0028A2462C|nr:TRAP transporter small permease [Sedimentibacter sp.]